MQMPYHEEMGEVNKTVLRCCDGTFNTRYSEINEMKLASKKQVKAVN